MSESKTIARPYASACFNVAQETGKTDDWFLFLEAAAEVVKDEAMLNLVKSPGIDKQTLAKTIVAISNEASGASESCLLYTSPSPRDGLLSRMPSSA